MNKWPDEHVAILRKMEGHTAAEMAAALHAYRPNVSRSAIIGQCHRRGIRLSKLDAIGGGPTQRAARIKARKLAQKEKAPFHDGAKAKPPRPAPSAAFSPLPGAPPPVTLLERGLSCCAWPIDGGGERLFCGLACPDDALPYCAAHRARRTRRYAAEAAA